ncbi:MAG: hypothetical protein EB060_10360 [Proteobacteria bacterium]|nr:hypothetical protein [Pseudomonadota bacterium]
MGLPKALALTTEVVIQVPVKAAVAAPHPQAVAPMGVTKSAKAFALAAQIPIADRVNNVSATQETIRNTAMSAMLR